MVKDKKNIFFKLDKKTNKNFWLSWDTETTLSLKNIDGWVLSGVQKKIFSFSKQFKLNDGWVQEKVWILTTKFIDKHRNHQMLVLRLLIPQLY